MPDRSNPFSAWSAGDQANIRQQLLDQLHTGQLNPAQRTGVLNALTASNPQAGTSTFSLATGVPLTPGGIAGGLASSAGRGLWDLAQGILGLADPNLTPTEKNLMKYTGSRYPLLSPVPVERMVKGVAQGLGGLPQLPAAMRDIYQSGRTGLAAAAMTEGPRLGAQLAGAELLGRAPGMASKLIPSEVRAARGFEYVEGRIGNQSLSASRSPQSALDLYSRIQKTGRISVPRPLVRFLNHVTSPGGISFQDARNFYTDINSLVYDREMPSQFKGPLKKLAYELGQDLRTTANQYGLGRVYDASLREFSKVQKYRGAAQALGRPVAGLAGYEAGSLTGIPHAGWVGAGLGYKYGPEVTGALADVALRRGAGRGLPGVPLSTTPITRALAYGGAAAGAGRNLPPSAVSTPSLTQREHSSLTPVQISQIIDKSAQDTQLDPRLLRVMMHQEDPTGDPRAVSPKGAMGQMQLMPGTARGLGVKDPFDPRENIPGGARYMRQMLDRYQGNMALALAAYNAGPEAVDKYGGIPPFPETQNYVRTIIARYRAVMLGGQATAKPPAAMSPVATGPAFGIPGQPPAPIAFGQQ